MLDWKVVCTSIGSALVATFATVFIQKQIKSRKNCEDCKRRAAPTFLELRRPPERWNTVLFFPDITKDDITTQQLIYYFENARIRIQLCLFRFSFAPLGDVIIKKFNNHRGLIIQIIVDHDVYRDTASGNGLLKRLKKQGVDVRTKKSASHMHHKFAIIDEEAVLTGSLNWTQQGVSQNDEDVLITTNPRHVSKYMQRFHLLWDKSHEADENNY